MADQPSPRSIAAKANRAKRRGLTPEGRERLRQTALKHKPWLHSTGPRTEAGKKKVALNGKQRQEGLYSVRELRRELASILEQTESMRNAREIADNAGGL